MGYYTGNGVVIDRRATPVCLAVTLEPTYSLNGVPQGWHRVSYLGVTVETITRKAGVQDPVTLSGASIVMSNTDPPYEASFTGKTASRIGDSNLFELIEVSRTTTPST